MKDHKPGAIGLTRREAIHIGLGALVGSAVAATGTRAEDGDAEADTTEQERLAISFWNFGLLSTGPNSIFHDLDARMAKTVQRGFNCIRTECGTGITHDAEGRPRGELEFHPVLPGHDHFTRELQHVRGGRIDLLKRLIELCTVARRYNVKLILSSWYYLHTFWFTDKNLTAELMGLPLEKRFMVFARGLDRILETLKERKLIDVVAFAEIFNEVDGYEFRGGYEAKNPTSEYLKGVRLLHEEALGFLRTRHPDVLFAVDTMMPNTVLDVIPRNAQVWNFHSYYLWPVYGVFEQGLMGADIDLNDPASYAAVRRFLRSDVVPLKTVVDSRAGRPPLKEDWYRRIWLYRNLDPNAMPELERLLQENLEKNIDRFKQRAADAVKQALKVRDELFPGIPLVLGEGASYCADHRLRWEERSDAYWEVVEHAARAWREHGFWGAVARTNSGPTDPVWHEYPERLQRANAVFLGKKP